MLRRYGNTGIWNALPPEFKKQRAEITASTNALAGFLESVEVIRNPEFYIPLKVLRTHVMNYARNNNMPIPQWNADFYRSPLLNSGCEITEGFKTKVYPIGSDSNGAPGIRVRDIYVIGVDLACEHSEDGAASAAPQADIFQQRKRQRVF